MMECFIPIQLLWLLEIIRPRIEIWGIGCAKPSSIGAATDLTPFKKHSDHFLMNSMVKPQKNGQRKWFIMTVFCLHCPTHQRCYGRSKCFKNFIITLLKNLNSFHTCFSATTETVVDGMLFL